MTTWTGTIPTFVAGDTTTVPTDLNTLGDALQAVSEAWTSWTPTLGGFTLGNGTLVCKYREVGKVIDIRGKFTAGSTSTFSSTFTLSPPVTPHSDYSADAAGVASFTDSSAGPVASRTGGTLLLSTTFMVMIVDRVASSPTVTNTVPWTWANGDTFSFQGRYEAA